MRRTPLNDATWALSLSSAFQRVFHDSSTSSQPSNGLLPELPGGTPLSLCPVSSPTDLFDVTYADMTLQPVYIDDDFYVHLYGTFPNAWSSLNATINTTIDCGSHCEMYGVPHGETRGSSFTLPFCMDSYIEQAYDGRGENDTCVASQGIARITSAIYVPPMYLSTPMWYNFTFDANTADGRRIYCLTAEVCLRWEDPKWNEGYPHGPWSDCQWPR